ncbi:MAG: hypothetical protein CMH54_10430 [Myxococcales bacterium]|nr:hypothetical protein [Myxococcales bacterium]
MYGFAPAAFGHPALHDTLSELDQHLDADPNQREDRLHRNHIYRKLGRWQDALVDINRLEKQYPNDTTIRGLRAQILVELGQLSRAEDALIPLLNRKAANIPTRDRADAHALMARILDASNRTAKAPQHLETALNLAPTMERVTTLARLYDRQGLYKQARDTWRKGLRIFPETTVFRLGLVAAERSLGRYSHAIRALNPVLAHARVQSRWLRLRAELYEQNGQPTEAANDRKAALKQANQRVRKRRTPLSLLERARAHQALGNTNHALGDVNTALTLQPGLRQAHELRQELELGSRIKH